MVNNETLDNYRFQLTNNFSFINQFALTVLLHSNDIGRSIVKNISGISDDDSNYVSLYFKLFGYKHGELQSWSELRDKVDTEIDRIKKEQERIRLEMEKEKERIRLERMKIWYNKLMRGVFGSLFVIIALFLTFIIVFLDFLLSVPSSIIKIFSKLFKKKENLTQNFNTTNYISYIKSKDNNTDVNIHITNPKDNEKNTSLSDDTKPGLAYKLSLLIKEMKTYQKFNSWTVTSLINIAIKIGNTSKLSNETKVKLIYLTSLFIVIYLGTNTTVKLSVGTIFLIFWGFTATFTYDKCGTPHKVPKSALDIPSVKDTVPVVKVDTLIQEPNEPKDDEDKEIQKPLNPIYSYFQYKKRIQYFFDDYTRCQALGGIGSRQINFFENEDFLDHSNEKYYVNSKDNTLFSVKFFRVLLDIEVL